MTDKPTLDLDATIAMLMSLAPAGKFSINHKAVLESFRPDLRGQLGFMDDMSEDEQYLMVGEFLLEANPWRS